MAGRNLAVRGDGVGRLSTMQKVKHIDWYIYDECDLRDTDLSERDLNGAHFISVDARGALFIKTQLQEADFYGADLRNAYFVEANLRNAHFEGANLRGACFDDSITDEYTTWYDAEFGDDEQEEDSERTTDGIEKIEYLEVYVFEEVEN